MTTAQLPEPPGQIGCHYLGNLYARWTLDGIVEIARTIANDICSRPSLYSQLRDDIAGLASNFRSRLGVDPAWPNSMQRRKMFHPLFGADAPVRTLSRSCREVAVDYFNSHSDVESAALLKVFDNRINLLRSYIDINESIISTIERSSDAIFFNSKTLITDETIAHAYGIKRVPNQDWPLDSKTIGQGGYLIELISDSLAPKVSPQFSQASFTRIQKIAQSGRRALDAAMSDAAPEETIGFYYEWAKALQDNLRSFDTTRIWHDPVYRAELCRWAEATLPEHPAGEIDLDNATFLNLVQTTVVQFNQSETANGDICCSSESISHCPGPNDLKFCPFCLISIHSQF